MPNRVIRDALLDSPAYHHLANDSTKLLYIELLLCADDYALVPIDPTYLRRHTTVCTNATEINVVKMLADLMDNDLIRPYETPRGSRFAFIPRFGSRPQSIKPKWPRPPAEIDQGEIERLLPGSRNLARKQNNDLRQLNTVRTSLNSVGTLCEMPKSKSKSNSNTKKKKSTCRAAHDAPPSFEPFWQAYPHFSGRSSRATCVKLWCDLKLETLAPVLMATLTAAKLSPDWTKNGGEFVPAAQVWLRKRLWEQDSLGRMQGEDVDLDAAWGDRDEA